VTWRVAGGVTLLWLLVAIVWGAQSSLGASLQGETQAIGPAIVDTLHLTLPWIPGTLAVIALTSRFPFTRATWPKALAVHVAGLLAVAWGTNALVVLGYWIRFGPFRDAISLAREAARWGLVRLHFSALLYGAIAALTQGVATWREVRRREVRLARLETQLAESRLQVLSAQIQPHFLFNTLHAIGQLWRSGRSDEAEAMLDHLGSLFQKVIASTSRTQVPLSEELQVVRDYLAIEHVRFGDRMRSRVDAEEAALACLVPPLILQPLVENAVKHGVAASATQVGLEARVRDGWLVVVVSDDGPGVPSGGTSGTGVGLANVRERLATLYGARQRLETTSRPGAGTVVRLEIPAISEGTRG
jgi:two-component system, LytTR family, sensor kinase